MTMALGSASASAQDFATRAQAMDYISATLPRATAANPKYLTKADGAVTAWLTDEIGFSTDAAGGVLVTMREHFVQTKAGATTQARHEARFAMADVKISPYLAPEDATPDGASAIGIAFTCKTTGCVAALWGDAPSKADSTDVYVQDVATRDRLLAAFQRLQTP